MKFLSFSYSDLKKLNYKDFFWRLYAKSFDEADISSNAAQVAYFFLFALFPLLLFLVSIFGIVIESADDLKTEMFQYLKQAMPGSAYDLVQNTIQEVTQSSSGGKLTFGILVALYSASAGIDSIRVVLNGVYNLAEKRPWWKTKLLSLALTLGLGILVTVALGIVLYGSRFTTLLLDWLNLPIQSPVILQVLQISIAGIVLVLSFALLYNYLPNHKNNKWTWVTPGAIIGIILWLVLSLGFRLYLSYFNTYDKTYGSLGAVIILMLWLYLTALVILIGGSINAVLQEFTDPETAEAGAKKAAAQETVDNPEAGQTESVADKKAEIASPASPDARDEIVQTEKATAPEAKSEVIAEADSSGKPDGQEEKPAGGKSALKLGAGLVIGFLQNFFSRKKR